MVPSPLGSTGRQYTAHRLRILPKLSLFPRPMHQTWSQQTTGQSDNVTPHKATPGLCGTTHTQTHSPASTQDSASMQMRTHTTTAQPLPSPDPHHTSTRVSRRENHTQDQGQTRTRTQTEMDPPTHACNPNRARFSIRSRVCTEVQLGGTPLDIPPSQLVSMLDWADAFIGPTTHHEVGQHGPICDTHTWVAHTERSCVVY